MIEMILISIVTPPPNPETVEPFTWKPSMLRNIEGAENRPWYQSLTFWSIVFILIWGTLYWWFW